MYHQNNRPLLHTYLQTHDATHLQPPTHRTDTHAHTDTDTQTHILVHTHMTTNAIRAKQTSMNMFMAESGQKRSFRYYLVLLNHIYETLLF